VIEAVNAALATLDRTQMGMLQGRLDGYNNLGCPIDAHCNPQTYPVILGAFDEPEASQGIVGSFDEPEASQEIRTEQSLPREFAVTGVVPNPLSGSTAVSFACQVRAR